MTDEEVEFIHHCELSMASYCVWVMDEIQAARAGGWDHDSDLLAELLRMARSFAAFPPRPWAIKMAHQRKAALYDGD